ncbi:type II toxin-antitoxin system RelE/ParE family toxin [Pirellulaceae bacterium SH449]
MDISFRTKKLAKLCNSEKELRGKLGKPNADKLKQRLNELAAAETLEDMRHLPGARCHELTGNLKRKLAVDLAHPDRLVFYPNHDPLPTRKDGGLNWAEVMAICIDGVGDYH